MTNAGVRASSDVCFAAAFGCFGFVNHGLGAARRLGLAVAADLACGGGRATRCHCRPCDDHDARPVVVVERTRGGGRGNGTAGRTLRRIRASGIASGKSFVHSALASFDAPHRRRSKTRLGPASRMASSAFRRPAASVPGRPGVLAVLAVGGWRAFDFSWGRLGASE
jgi:hypothetical protein